MDLINVSSPALSTRRAWIRRLEGDEYEIELDEADPDLEIGARVVLNWRQEAGRRISGIVTAVNGKLIELKARQTAPPEQRAYPRQMGGIPMRYRVVPGSEGAMIQHWLDGADVTTKQAWCTPDPFMNFSVTGLRFEDVSPCKEDDVLIGELSVTGEDGIWRFSARVVRVFADGVDGAHAVVVHFLDLPQVAIEALTNYTLRLQRAQFN